MPFHLLVESVPNRDIFVVALDDELGIIEVIINDLWTRPGAVFIEQRKRSIPVE